MLKLLVIGLLSVSSIAFANEKEQKPHIHGEARVSIAFDGKKGRIELRVPTEAIYGFEHEAKSAKDRANKDQAMSKLSDKVGEMFVFDEGLKCEVRLDMYEVLPSKKHSDVEADYNVTCAELPAGHKLSFHLAKVFPRIKKTVVEYLAEDVQKSQVMTKDGDSIELK